MEDNVYKLGVMESFTGSANGSDYLPAIVSIEIQKFNETCDTEAGFNCGTVFPELNKPFLAGGMTR